jgi:hypothetical protein
VQFLAEHRRLPRAGEIYHDDENVIAGRLSEVARLRFNPEQRQTFGPGDDGPNEAAIAALDPGLRTSTDEGKITLAIHLPPLYYLLCLPLYWLARGGDLLARVFLVRQLSVAMGVATVALSAAIARQVYPRRRAMWHTVPLLVSFQPMFTFVTSVVNTDALLILVCCALIYFCLRVLRDGLTVKRGAALGIALAAGLLIKPFILGMAVPLAAALAVAIGRDLAAARREGVSPRPVWRCALRSCGALAAAVVLLWGPWVWHSARLGNNPFYANPIRIGQYVLENPVYGYRLLPYLADYGRSLLGGTWATLWGYFGWLDTPLSPAVYRALYVVCGLALVGLVVYGVRAVRARSGDRPEQAGQQALALGFLALVLLSFVGTIGAMNYYSWRTRGLAGGIQGRYYLGAIVPLVTLLAAGLLAPLPGRLRPVGHWLLCWAMVVLNAVSFFQGLLPRYYL